MYRRLGHDRESFAKLFQVASRTVRNWEAGKSRIPYVAFKLLRLLLRDELPGWEDWRFEAGRLVSPEGHHFGPKDFSWLSLTVRQARTCSVLYHERQAMLREIEAAHEQIGLLRVAVLSGAGTVKLVDLVAHGTPLFDLLVDVGQAGLSVEKRAAAGAVTRGGLVTRPVCLTGETFEPLVSHRETLKGGAL